MEEVSAGFFQTICQLTSHRHCFLKGKFGKAKQQRVQNSLYGIFLLGELGDNTVLCWIKESFIV